MEERISILMSLLEIDIVRFINIEENSCGLVIDGMLSCDAIEKISENYYMSICVSALEQKLMLCLLDK